MSRRIASGIALAAGLCMMAGDVAGQVVERERDVTITGPRGRTIERQIRSERGPGMINREVTVQRPGGTLRRDVYVQRPAPFFGGGGGWLAGGGPRFIERDVIVAPRPVWGPPLVFGPPLAFGVGLPFLNFNFGVPAPPPVVVTPPPVVAGGAAVPGAVAAPTAVVPDAFTDSLTRLKSHHEHSRRDGALTLGRLKDPRAVPALVDRLDNDHAKEVRLASAWALGEIGDPRAAVALQRAALFDWRKDVRDAAMEAYRRMPQEGQVAQGTAPATLIPNSSQALPPSTAIQTEPSLNTPPPDPTPPPPPEPAAAPFRSSGFTDPK